MLLALVLAACVAPAAHEWVEISQQHYRKPPHAHSTAGIFYPADEQHNDDGHTFYPTIDGTKTSDHVQSIDRHGNKRPIYKEPIKHNPNRVYPNHSITEHKWNIDRVGNIKRINGNVKIRPNITPEFSLEIYGEVTESEPEQVTNDYSSAVKDKETFSATIERVSNKGSVKRVQLPNTPVKSPSVTHSVSPIRRNYIKPHGPAIAGNDFRDEFEIETDIFKKSQENATPMNHIKNIFVSTKQTTTWKDDTMGISTSEPELVLEKYSQTHQLDDLKKVNNNLRDMGNYSNIRNISSVEGNQVFNAYSNTAVKTKLQQNIKEQTSNFIAKNEKNNRPEDVSSEGVTIGPDNSLNATNNTVDEDSRPSKDHKSKPNIDTSSKNGANDRKEDIKVNTIEKILKFVKVVADTISKNTKRGVNGKVQYLNELKDTLLGSINERIEAAWPDDAGRGARRSRSARGHVEFPSSESSLMTISFLTFAVFLIKLVLQVIQTYKNKTMMVAPVMVATAGRALPKLPNFT